MRTRLRRYRVMARRNGEEMGHLLVSAIDEAGALSAFWDLSEQFQISPQDRLTEVRVQLERPVLL